jgi:hypothetical protein
MLRLDGLTGAPEGGIVKPIERDISGELNASVDANKNT